MQGLAVLAGGVLAGVLGCSKIAGIEDYRVGPRPSDAAQIAHPFLAGEACTLCLSNSCTGSEAECESDPACQTLLACRRKCADPVCHRTCMALAHATGSRDSVENAAIAAMNALGSCANRNCPDECRMGQNWACVGGYPEPDLYPPSEASIEIGVNVVRFPANAPADDVLVRACRRFGNRCDGIDDETVTRKGVAWLSVPAERRGFADT